jgi:hypothetical protein
MKEEEKKKRGGFQMINTNPIRKKQRASSKFDHKMYDEDEEEKNKEKEREQQKEIDEYT